MKPSLQLSLSQRLSLTPQLQQSIRLLQLSTIELEQEVEKYLLDNPLLLRVEEEKDYAPPNDNTAFQSASSGESGASSEDAWTIRESAEGALSAPDENSGDFQDSSAGGLADIGEDIALSSREDLWTPDESPYGALPASSPSDDEDNDTREAACAVTLSLREHLAWQLGMMPFSDRDRALIHYLIDALDENGYITLSFGDLIEHLPPELGARPSDLRIALQHLRHLDPTGVGAWTLKECLSLQLADLPPDETRELALCIVQDHLDILANRDFVKLKKQMACDDDSLRRAHALIQRLNPRPGAQYAVSDTRYITPDIVVQKIRGRWVVHINGDAYPRVRVNTLYARILSGHRGSNLSGHLQEARWLIKSIQQRFETILSVAQSIVDKQRQFFEYGEIAMRPMVLREIADALGLHESTVSRVTTQKYMATPRGVFEMKYFFGSHVATDAGGACSATAIRALIKQLVGEENSQAPLSDSQIANLLGQQGIVVARRTVAKYREALNIPPVKQRKAI